MNLVKKIKFIKGEISNVKINISKGQKIGIIGPTASGKSTIVEIVTGILEPTKDKVIKEYEKIKKFDSSFVDAKLNKISGQGFHNKTKYHCMCLFFH